jgi:hypothetical protein
MSRFAIIVATPVEVFFRELEGLLPIAKRLQILSRRSAAEEYLVINSINTTKCLYFPENIHISVSKKRGHHQNNYENAHIDDFGHFGPIVLRTKALTCLNEAAPGCR